jgi:hypothetical protein
LWRSSPLSRSAATATVNEWNSQPHCAEQQSDTSDQAIGLLPAATGTWRHLTPGLFGTVEEADELKGAPRAALAHDGPALVDVHGPRPELSLPPKITVEQAKGFGLFAMRTIHSGEGDQIIDVAKTNLRQLARE